MRGRARGPARGLARAPAGEWRRSCRGTRRCTRKGRAAWATAAVLRLMFCRCGGEGE